MLESIPIYMSLDLSVIVEVFPWPTYDLNYVSCNHFDISQSILLSIFYFNALKCICRLFLSGGREGNLFIYLSVHFFTPILFESPPSPTLGWLLCQRDYYVNIFCDYLFDRNKYRSSDYPNAHQLDTYVSPPIIEKCRTPNIKYR